METTMHIDDQQAFSNGVQAMIGLEKAVRRSSLGPLLDELVSTSRSKRSSYPRRSRR
jgi:hypothetical protein